MACKVIALVGTYRKGGTIDMAVDEMLKAAQEAGAEVKKLYLIEEDIRFCANCRVCTQAMGPEPGACPTQDGMKAILDEALQSDGLIIASPVNFGSMTAVTKRFMERLVCLAYWPWGTTVPKVRNKEKSRRAVLVTSSAAPAIFLRLMTGILKSLRQIADLLGAKTIGAVVIGMAALEQHGHLNEKTRHQARRLGRRLATR